MLYKTINQTSSFTASKLSAIRKALDTALADSPHSQKITVIAAGSYGRSEASEESDLDLFILFDSDQTAENAIPDELNKIKGVVDQHVPNSVGATGTFGPDVLITFRELVSNIGGDLDNNKALTRRMLFLLESVHLYGEERFQKYQSDLLAKYILQSSPDDQVSKFLLNDIIRYYRTITTDFEFKVSEEHKEWGLRNIKLRFSRKLIYFGGLVVAAELVGMDKEKRIQRALELFKLPVLDRLAALDASQAHSESILALYEEFLAAVSDPDQRNKLKRLEKDNRNDCETFKALRSCGLKFSKALDGWLKGKYDSNHPIHHALIF